MKTVEVARSAGVNTQTLRYYERRGLLPEPGRSAAGYRSYGPEAVRIVRFVKGAQRLGFSLADIEVLLRLAAGFPDSDGADSDGADWGIPDCGVPGGGVPGGGVPGSGGAGGCDAARDLAVSKIIELEAKIAQLTAMRDSLRSLVATCDRPPAARECPLLDALNTAGVKRAVDAAGP